MLRQLSLYGFCFAIVQLLLSCGQPETQSIASEGTERGEEQVVEAVQNIDKTNPEPLQNKAASAQYFILAFGDSLYAGYQLPPKDGFAPKLQAALQEQGLDGYVHNAGVSGDTTAAGLRRMEFVLDSLDRKPDLVLLGLGGNDMLRGIDAEKTRSNMDAMAKIVTDRGIPLMLTGMLAPPNLGPDYRARFDTIYPALAQKYDAALYPFFMKGIVGEKAFFLSDNIHPNAQGIDVIVGNMAPAVARILSPESEE